MLRASVLLTVFVLLSIASGEVLAQREKDDVRFKSGNIQVIREPRSITDDDGKRHEVTTHRIMRDGIHFGLNIDEAKYRRIPATYHHPLGPFGMAMQKFNWFPGKPNAYHADARMPASIVALGMNPGIGSMPLAQFVSLWSEPPVAVIGMEAGAPASYARPYQYFDFFEPSKEVIKLNGKGGFFHFIPDAETRGSQIRIFQGAPRQELKKRGPEKFYQLILLEACSGEDGEKIFLEFFTKEGISQLVQHLTDDGVLCVHTSHRFVNLPPVLATIGKELGLHVRRGHDSVPFTNATVNEYGHFTSEWVLLARKEEVLRIVCKTPPNYAEAVKQDRFLEEYWTTPKLHDHVWTDNGPNLLKGVLRGHPATMGYQRMLSSTAESLQDAARGLGMSRGTQFMIRGLSHMPRGLEAWYVDWQLRNHPRVEELWPGSN